MDSIQFKLDKENLLTSISQEFKKDYSKISGKIDLNSEENQTLTGQNDFNLINKGLESQIKAIEGTEEKGILKSEFLQDIGKEYLIYSNKEENKIEKIEETSEALLSDLISKNEIEKESVNPVIPIQNEQLFKIDTKIAQDHNEIVQNTSDILSIHNINYPPFIPQDSESTEIKKELSNNFEYQNFESNNHSDFERKLQEEVKIIDQIIKSEDKSNEFINNENMQTKCNENEKTYPELLEENNSNKSKEIQSTQFLISKNMDNLTGNIQLNTNLEYVSDPFKGNQDEIRNLTNLSNNKFINHNQLVYEINKPSYTIQKIEEIEISYRNEKCKSKNKNSIIETLELISNIPQSQDRLNQDSKFQNHNAIVQTDHFIYFAQLKYEEGSLININPVSKSVLTFQHLFNEQTSILLEKGENSSNQEKSICNAEEIQLNAKEIKINSNRFNNCISTLYTQEMMVIPKIPKEIKFSLEKSTEDIQICKCSSELNNSLDLNNNLVDAKKESLRVQSNHIPLQFSSQNDLENLQIVQLSSNFDSVEERNLGMLGLRYKKQNVICLNEIVYNINNINIVEQKKSFSHILREISTINVCEIKHLNEKSLINYQSEHNNLTKLTFTSYPSQINKMKFCFNIENKSIESNLQHEENEIAKPYFESENINDKLESDYNEVPGKSKEEIKYLIKLGKMN